ncbi:MAG: hypothetical protein KJO98_04200 [Rhodothermia bacterium]|nr:hypothetical protein [Rhodothermia bacterium]
MLLLLFISGVIALVVHVLLGWPWSILGGVAAGWLAPRGGWWRGALAVGMAWLILIGYNFIVANGPVREMHRVVAGVAGDLPGWTIPGLSLFVGILIGAAGGLVGTSLARVGARRKERTVYQ